MNNKKEQGFSLFELVVVCLIIGVISALAVIGYVAVRKNTTEAMQTTRLMQFVDVQNRFKTVMGKRRYATLEELRSAGLLNESIIRFDRSGEQEPIEGWVLTTGDESRDFLEHHFRAFLKKGGKVRQFCISEDGILRRAVEDSPDSCDSQSPAVAP